MLGATGIQSEAARAPEYFRIAMAALDLLSEVASDTPLLLIAEDAHWLDRPTADVLAFIARRLESDQIVLLAAVRDGYPSVLHTRLRTSVGARPWSFFGAPTPKASCRLSAMTRDRLSAVVDARRAQLGDARSALLDAMFNYWRAAGDLVQRQEHAGQREGQPLGREDGGAALRG